MKSLVVLILILISTVYSETDREKELKDKFKVVLNGVIAVTNAQAQVIENKTREVETLKSLLELEKALRRDSNKRNKQIGRNEGIAIGIGATIVTIALSAVATKAIADNITSWKF